MRKRNVLIAATASFGAAAVVAGVTLTTGTVPAPTAAPAVTDMVAAAATADPSVVCGAVPAPTWLPSDVDGQQVTCGGEALPEPTDGSMGVLGGDTAEDVEPIVLPEGVNEVVYTLAGEKNDDTYPEEIEPAQWPTDQLESGELHPGSDVLHMTYENTTRMEEPLGGEGLVVEQVDLSNGATARVTTTDNGLGPVRVEWVHAGNSHLLLTSRFNTDQGVSGVVVEDLLTMAASVQ